jgi:molecular chaperone GrpE
MRRWSNVTEQVQDIPEKPQEEEPVVAFVREAQAPSDELEALKEELDHTHMQAAEYLDGWQRARAELANARRRFEKERSEAGQLANITLLRRILPALDDLDRALKTMPAELRDNSWANGVSLVQRKFSNVLESEGVKPIEVKAGDTFDPQWHEAVTHEDSEQFKEGEIIAEVQKGYVVGEQVLRPSLVRVAR